MKKIAVLIPCFNEGKTIGRVVSEFRAELPAAEIYVYDNNSTDNTAAEAGKARALVRREMRRGKGNVVRSMFSDIEADVYVMVDGDGTYPPEKVRDIIGPVIRGEADVALGSRLHKTSDSRFKPLNRFGNMSFAFLIRHFFGVTIKDVLSGYMALNKRVVKGLPLVGSGFEIEAEIVIKCLRKGYRITEVPVTLALRHEESASKIKIFRDGLAILNTIVILFTEYKPLTAFGLLGLFFVLAGLVPGFIVIREYLETGFVYRLPSAVLAVGLVLVGVISGLSGLVLHAVSRHLEELDGRLRQMERTKAGDRDAE